VSQSDTLAEYVKRLEEAHEDPERTVGPRAAEDLAAEVERYLREHGGTES
jgi:hypothetical protein